MARAWTSKETLVDGFRYNEDREMHEERRLMMGFGGGENVYTYTRSSTRTGR